MKMKKDHIPIREDEILKICVPTEVKAGGGSYRFLENFISYIKSHDVEVTDGLSDKYNIIFANAWQVEYKDLLMVKRKRPEIKIVHRVDGSSLDYGGYISGDLKQAKVNLLADLTIFQSRYGKYATTQKYKIILNDGLIINNPVDLNTFSPVGGRLNIPGQIKVACATWSYNSKKGAQDIYEIARHNSDINFVLCGRYPDAPNLSNIQRLGVLGKNELACAFRACDIFLHMAENDPCPNVVLEALASGLPVLYRDSGGTPEVVGDCGAAVTVEDFRKGLENVLEKREEFVVRARQRAVKNFAPDVIFPKYLDAISSCVRARGKKRKYNIGWILISGDPSVDSARLKKKTLQGFDYVRYSVVTRVLNKTSKDFSIERYNPSKKYDLVIFGRLMSSEAKAELGRIKGYGGKVIFDANVNYYEIEGEFRGEGARFKPTPEQQESAVFMTENADCVIADSTYLYEVCKRYNEKVFYIPDAVDLSIFDGKKTHRYKNSIVLLWSGVSSKSYHLELVKEVLTQLKNIELLIISDDGQLSSVIQWLKDRIPCRFAPHSYSTFPKLVKKADILISPKILNNSYEKGHTEYKITVGMAQSLPVVASPQQSYIDCLNGAEAGFICTTEGQWYEKLNLLIENPVLRNCFGDNARRRVVEAYSGEVVARKYLMVFEDILGCR